jgi:hypothetical protein
MNITKTGKTVAQREDEGTTIHVRDEAGDKMWQDEAQTKPVTITVAGSYSSRFRRLAEASGDRAWKKAGRMDAEDQRRNSLEIVAGCVLAWDGFTVGEGPAEAPYACTKANAIALLDQCVWIRDQVEKAMSDHALFSQPVSLT